MSFISQSTVAPNGATDGTFTAPATIQNDDILVILYEIEDDVIPTPPAGFTQWFNINHASQTLNFYAWWKRASSESGSYLVDHVSTWRAGWMGCFRGRKTTGDPADVDQSENTGNSTTPTALGVTVSQADVDIIYGLASYLVMGVGTPPTGYTERYDPASDGTIYVATHNVGAGATGNQARSAISSTHWITSLITLAPAGSGAQTISPTAKASSVAFGTSKTNLTILPSARASTLTLGALKLNLTIRSSAKVSGLVFGSPTLVPGAVTISPSSKVTGLTFGSLTLLPGAVIILPDSKTSGLTFGTVKLNLVIQPTALASSLVFGTSQINLKILMSSVASSLLFGTAAIAAGDRILPDSLLSTLVFGGLSLNPIIKPTALPSGLTFGSFRLVSTISPSGVASTLAIGQPQLAVIIQPASRTSSLVFGTLQLNFRIFPGSRTSSLVFGTLSIFDTDAGVILEPPFTVITDGYILTVDTTETILTVYTENLVRTVDTENPIRLVATE